MKIGIDLDHTIINYHDAFLNSAKQWNLVPDTFAGNKNNLKNHIQTQHSDEHWMRLQGYIYGKGIQAAQLMPNVIEFLRRCRALSIPFVIISHKTQFGHFDEDQIDLRETARHWLKKQELFDDQSINLQDHQLFFAQTRDEKLRMIAQEGCTLFIDDLLSVLMEPTFPTHVKRVWYAYETQMTPVPNTISVIDNWQQAMQFLEINYVSVE